MSCFFEYLFIVQMINEKTEKKSEKRLCFVYSKKTADENPVMNLFQRYNATSKSKNAKLILSIGSK
jgi:hypothetical protein